ncbi:MAG: redoxin domain-containing protein [Pyrinomonadaceae bacterium]|nr:redoxin domain-containing protein [Pyrinomonadaceae bacterium]
MNLRVAAAITLIIGSIACATKLNSSPSGTADLKPRDSPVAVGEMAPDFTLEDQNNRKAKLSSARGSMPTVLVFYRGNW